jgi:5-methylcytosine-specific restriction enzyme A
MRNEWTDSELKYAIIAYLKMLSFEKKGTPYVKAEVNRELQKKLTSRSHKSIEYRWQNISAVLQEKKRNFIAGYKPASHVGSTVKERIWEILQKEENQG